MEYIEIDIHRKFSEVNVMDKSGKEIERKIAICGKFHFGNSSNLRAEFPKLPSKHCDIC